MKDQTLLKAMIEVVKMGGGGGGGGGGGTLRCHFLNLHTFSYGILECFTSFIESASNVYDRRVIC